MIHTDRQNEYQFPDNARRLGHGTINGRHVTYTVDPDGDLVIKCSTPPGASKPFEPDAVSHDPATGRVTYWLWPLLAIVGAIAFYFGLYPAA